MIDCTSSHIQITLDCRECGHQWDVDDYTNYSTEQAEADAEYNEECPECAKL